MARVLVMLLLVLCPIGVRGAPGHHTFWEVRGKYGVVYLLGSVHMLKPGDSALPSEAVGADAPAKAVVFVVDIKTLPLDRLQGSDLTLEMLPQGQTLDQVLGPDLYDDFLAHAQPLGLKPEQAAHAQPWLAALMLEQLELARFGFETDAGVDEQLARRARVDHKPIIALETVNEQLGFFAHLTLAQQCAYLRSTMHDLDQNPGETDEIVRAWQQGDVPALTRLLVEDQTESPELFHVLTVERNQRWLPRIRQLLSARGDYLVVVGALHLVGRDGLVESLRREGYQIVQH
jgi:uncharacterized protein YbaP (TraB family)